MIELNLIEAASRPVSVASPAVVVVSRSGTSGKKKVLAVILSIVVVLVCGLGVLKIVGLPHALEGVLPTPVLDAFGIDDPSRVGPAISSRTSGQLTTAGGTIESRRAAEEEAALREALASSAERIVKDVQPSMFGVEKRSDFASLLPMERIAFEKSMAAQILAFINAVTPDGISFAELTYAAPNYYYIRGVAESPNSQRNYLERLKMGSSDFKTPELPENAPATSVTAYGVISAKVDPPGQAKGPLQFVKESEVASEIDALRGLDPNGRMKLSGLKNPKTEDFGVFKSITYKVTTSADFQTVLHFVEALSKSPVRIGLERVRMTASGKNGVSTAMTFVLYTSN
jgi:hypothetical protein